MSSLLDPTPPSPDPIAIWILTAHDGAHEIDSALLSAGGSTRNVDKYYHRTIKLNGIIRHIRGRCELLIFSEKDEERVQERLNHPNPRERARARRLTPDELAAIQVLEADPTNWKMMGGVKMFMQPADEDLPDYPPQKKILPPKGGDIEGGVSSQSYDPISDMQNEGGPPSPPPFKGEGEGEG